jgi:ribosomal protein S12 methylthiotransferase
MYLHPSRVDDALLDLVSSEPRVCSYLDIPLQHSADPILKGMRRSPGSSGIRELVSRIRRRAPQVALRTSFIVGFPGETTKHFAELLDFVEWARFDKVGVFPYSPEEGTAAASMRPRPRNATAQRRCEELMTLQREISAEICESRIGAEIAVIVDGPAEEGRSGYEGRSEWDAPEIDGRVHLPTLASPRGPFVRARVDSADDYDLYATVTD